MTREVFNQNDLFIGPLPKEAYNAVTVPFSMFRQDNLVEFAARSLYGYEKAVRGLEEQEAELEEIRADKFDDLTNLLHRRSATRAANKLLERVGKERFEDPVSVLCFKIDIVDFKDINRYKTYEGGDEYIKAVADFLRDHVARDTDILTRWGGDEFIILAPVYRNSSEDEVRALIEARLAEIPKSEHFAKMIRWDCTVYEAGDDFKSMQARIDITTDEGKDNAKYSQLNELYSNT
jgi:diguanylate cyclase (GGDEF)-like protein